MDGLLAHYAVVDCRNYVVTFNPTNGHSWNFVGVVGQVAPIISIVQAKDSLIVDVKIFVINWWE